MEIKHEHLRQCLRGWASATSQRYVSAEITRAYFSLSLPAPALSRIELPAGDTDFAAWHNNKQQIFRWLDSDTAASVEKIRLLQPAILAALPAELKARLCAGNSIEYLAVRALAENQQAITAAILGASLANFESKWREANRSFSELKRAYSALH